MKKIPRVVLGLAVAVWAALSLPAAVFAQCQHEFAEDVREPDCVTPGIRVEYCTICGETGDSFSIDPLGHDLSDWQTTVEPGCETTGEERRQCSRCDLYESRNLPQIGHDYDDGVLTKEPTTTTMGRVTYTCRRCGDSYEETTPKWHDPFDDVMPRHYFYTSVLWAYNNGITSGVAPNRFGPNYDCTRGQVVTFLWRAMGSPEPASEENPFVDVGSSDYFIKAVLWAYHAGVTAGVDAAHFAPGQTCTRAQVVTFLYSAKGRPGYEGKVSFVDVPESAYYYEPVLWAAERGITAGIGNGRFGPEDRCVRGQIVTFLYQARGV